MWINLESCPVSPRVGASLNECYDKIVLFAGANHEEGPQNDTWFYSPKEKWIRVTPCQISPPPRYDHAAASYINHNGKQSLLIFGGCGETGPLNDLWSLDLKSWTWTKCMDSGDKPSARTIQYMPTINNSKLYIWGGGFSGDEAVQDQSLYSLDIDNFHWDKHSFDLAPSVRQGHSLIAHNNTLYLYGGMNGSFVYNQLWKYNINESKWSLLDKSDAKQQPAGRSGHNAVLLDNKFCIYGGLARDPKVRVLGDIAIYNIDSQNWEMDLDSSLAGPGLYSNAISGPECRIDCAACAVPINALGNMELGSEDTVSRGMIVFGGMDFGSTYNDVYLQTFE